MTLKTLILSRFYPPPWGAASVRAKFLTKALRKSGLEVDILVPLQPNRSERTAKGEYGERILARRFYSIPRTLFLDFPSTLIGSLALIQNLDRHSPYDVCVAMSPPPDVVFISYWLKRLGLVRRVLVDVRDDVASTIRHLFGYEGPSSDLQVALSRLALKRYNALVGHSDAIVAVTEGLACHIGRLVGREVSVVYNGAPVAQFMNTSLSRKESFPLRNAILVADLDAPYHCVDTMIQTLKRTLDSTNLSPSITVVGDGRFKREYEAQATRFDLTDHVRFLGPVPFTDLPQVLWTHDFGIVGRPEGLNWRLSIPNKVFEYISAGLPVFAFGPAESEMGRFIEEHGIGQYVPSTHPDEIASQLEVFANSRFDEDKLRAASEVYDREQWSERMVGIISDVAHGGVRRGKSSAANSCRN